jgi:uncharacterized protein YjbI with pentapeptide repeats
MSKPGKVLKGLCKKLGVRLTVKRGKKRVYKSIAVLKRQCANKKKKKKVKKVVKRKRRFGMAPPSSFFIEKAERTRNKASRVLNIDGLRKKILENMGEMNKNTAIKKMESNVQQIIQTLEEGRVVRAPGAYLRGANLSFKGIQKVLPNVRSFDTNSNRPFSQPNPSTRRANFEGADLREAKLSDLRGVNLRGADLRGADLGSVRHFIEQADLRGADLRGADIEDMLLIGTMYSIGFLNTHPGTFTKGPNFEGANFEGANLRKRCLVTGFFKKANLKGAVLEDSDLRGINLEKANLEGASLLGVKLQRLLFPLRNRRPEEIFQISEYFRRWSELRDNKLYIITNLKGANLKGAKLWLSNLQGANLRGANLQDANLSMTNLQGANLQNADLSMTNLQGANLKGSDLRGALLREADFIGAEYNDATQFPEGFNPEERGMVRVNNFGKKKRRKVKKKKKSKK